MFRDAFIQHEPRYVPPLRKDRSIDDDQRHCRLFRPKPMTILRKLGISKARAFEALAATGNHSADEAVKWLARHANDPRFALSDCDMPICCNDTPPEDSSREYCLMICPAGEFRNHLRRYFEITERCGFNDALDYLPHMKLTPFFRSPSARAKQLIKAFIDTVKYSAIGTAVKFDVEISDTETRPYKIELVAHREYTRRFFNMALMFAENARKTRLFSFDVEQPDQGCLPFCSRDLVPDPDIHEDRILRWQQLPENRLSIPLAENFCYIDFHTLNDTAEQVNRFSAPDWDLKLYSRDPHLADCMLFTAKDDYDKQQLDELSFLKDDHIFCTPEAHVARSDEWVMGESLSTGERGFYPKNFMERVPQSDGWALHATYSLVRETVDPGPSEDDRLGVDWFTRVDPTRRKLRAQKKRYCIDDFANTFIDSNVAVVPWNADINQGLKKISSERKLFIMRHVERVDKTFAEWLPFAYDRHGVYSQIDVNLPTKLFDRGEATMQPAFEWARDPPITEIGKYQAFLMGREFRRVVGSLRLSYVYSSPAYRCVQTAYHFLRGLDCPTHKIKIRIEPGLYEWHERRSEAIPTFLTTTILREEVPDIDRGYIPIINRERLESIIKTETTMAAVYERHFRVSNRITKNLGDGHTVFVAHAINFETSIADLVGAEHKTYTEICDLARYIPYGAIVAIEQLPDDPTHEQWKISDQSMKPLTHSRNFMFDSSIIKQRSIPNQEILEQVRLEDLPARNNSL